MQTKVNGNVFRIAVSLPFLTKVSELFGKLQKKPSGEQKRPDVLSEKAISCITMT